MMKQMFQASICPILFCALLATILELYPTRNALAEDAEKLNLVLIVEPEQDNFRDANYGYRKITHNRTVNLMLYGFQGEELAAASTTPVIPKERKPLSGFFKQHFDRIKQDHLGQDTSSTMRIVAGDQAFTSAQINRGLDSEPAKMAGITIPIGRFTVGGGYMWGEKNPAMMQRADGMFFGVSYDTGNTGFQISYIDSGRDINSREISDNNIQYNSVMFGTSFKMNERLALTATAQYRQDQNSLSNDQDAVFTVGTRWKF